MERLTKQQQLQPFRADKQSDTWQSDEEINENLSYLFRRYVSALTFKNITHTPKYEKHGRGQKRSSDNL